MNILRYVLLLKSIRYFFRNATNAFIIKSVFETLTMQSQLCTYVHNTRFLHIAAENGEKDEKHQRNTGRVRVVC